MKPTIGRIVHYKMSDSDCFAIRGQSPFNHPIAGQTVPMLITAVDPSEPCGWVSGTVFLNNGNSFWAGTRPESDGFRDGFWFWPSQETAVEPDAPTVPPHDHPHLDPPQQPPLSHEHPELSTYIHNHPEHYHVLPGEGEVQEAPAPKVKK